MNELHNNILRLCESAGIKPGKMCDDIGISRSMISDLKNGRKQTFNAKILTKIAKYFGVTVESLLGEIENSPQNRTVEMLQSLRDEDRTLLQVARNMTPAEVQAAVDFLRRLKGGSDNAD